MTNEMVKANPIPSMYDIFTYIWLQFMVHIFIHGRYGNSRSCFLSGFSKPFFVIGT